MSAVDYGSRIRGQTLRRAALVAGLGYLLGPVAYATFTRMPKEPPAGA